MKGKIPSSPKSFPNGESMTIYSKQKLFRIYKENPKGWLLSLYFIRPH